MSTRLIALHGGEEFGLAGALTAELLRPYACVVLAPLARPASEWGPLERLAAQVLSRPLRLAHPSLAGLPASKADAVFIPGGDPAVAARSVTPGLGSALNDCSVVAASAGAMMLGEEMVAACPDQCGALSLVPGLGLIEGVVTPHAESLSPRRHDELAALVGDRPWRQIRTGEALVAARCQPGLSSN